MPVNVHGQERQSARAGDALYTVEVRVRLKLWSANPLTLLQRLQNGSVEFREGRIVYFTDFIGFDIERVDETYEF